MSRVTNRRFKQEYSFKGVTKAPDAYASEVMAGVRRSYVAAGASASFVRYSQWGDIIQWGKGTDWRVDYSQREYSLNVLQDQQTGGQMRYQTILGQKIPIGIEPRVRVVRFVIDVIIIETLSKWTSNPRAGLTEDSAGELDTDQISTAFNEIVKHIEVTGETSIIADEAGRSETSVEEK